MERKIKLPYGVEFAYHCQKCGGITDEYGKCYYCGSLNKLRYDSKATVQMYIELDDEKKFYFNHVLEIGAITEPETIETTCMMDTTRHYLRSEQNGRFNFTYLLTDDSAFKSSLLSVKRIKPLTINLITPHFPKVYRFRAEYLMNNIEISNSECATAEMAMYIHDNEGWSSPTLTAPDNARCPNCGAIVSKAYGICDYCGGWVEYR